MIFMVPIAPFGVFGYVHEASRGMVALTYLVGMVAMFFTATSYRAMSRAFPVAGSVYAYAQRGIHETVGFFAGWLILLDYVLVPALLYIVSAAALRPVLPGVPAWAWIVAFIAVNTAINVVGIRFTARANRGILVAEMAVLALYVGAGLIALLTADHAGGLTLRPLYEAEAFSLPMVMGAVSIAVLSFLGFDGISTFAEESRGGADAVGPSRDRLPGHRGPAVHPPPVRDQPLHRARRIDRVGVAPALPARRPLDHRLRTLRDGRRGQAPRGRLAGDRRTVLRGAAGDPESQADHRTGRLRVSGAAPCLPVIEP
jgi:hypothetical protein